MKHAAIIAGVALVALGDAWADSDTRAREIIEGDSFSQSEAAALLLDGALSSENFGRLVEKSGGTGKVMDTLSLLTSSPGAVGDRFGVLLEAAAKFPDSEAAEYLANNRYLTDAQVQKIGAVVIGDPNSRFAQAFVKSGGAGSEDLDRLVDLVVMGKAGEVGVAVAGANGLSPDSQKKLLFVSMQQPDGEVSRAFARNPFLNRDTMDSLGASAVKVPAGALAEGFGANPGMNESQMLVLVQVAIEIPDSGLAMGLGSNRGLKTSTFSQIQKTVESLPYSQLSVALAGNPNLPDTIFAILSKAVVGDKLGEMSSALAGKGGAAGNEVRAAELANLVIINPNLPICQALVDNPFIPPAHLLALQQEAARNPGSAVSRAFIDQIREKRFRGGRAEKMKILEAALMSGEVDSINTR